MEKEKRLFPLELQFFADGSQENADDNANPDNAGNEGGNEAPEKMFTQAQVNSMMAKEKNEGKRSILKVLGFKSEEEAGKAIDLYNALLESQKTEEQKNSDALEKANEEKEEYRLRAEAAENKAICFENGVDKDSIDDVLAIAKTKVNAKNDLQKVIADMKKDAKYSLFFAAVENNTGNDPGHGNKSLLGSENYGKRLAERVKTVSAEKKSSYF